MEEPRKHPLSYTYRLDSHAENGVDAPTFPVCNPSTPPPPEQPGRAWAVAPSEEEVRLRKVRQFAELKAAARSLVEIVKRHRAENEDTGDSNSITDIITDVDENGSCVHVITHFNNGEKPPA